MHKSISATTRKARKDEKNNSDYIFISEEEFGKAIKQGEFFQWIESPLGKYGILLSSTVDLLAKGCTIIMDLDPTGVNQIKKKCRNVSCVFLLPPSLMELRERLSSRGKDRGILSENDLDIRFNMAVEYIGKADLYDYVLINNDVQETADVILKIISVEKLRIEKPEILYKWENIN